MFYVSGGWPWRFPAKKLAIPWISSRERSLPFAEQNLCRAIVGPFGQLIICGLIGARNLGRWRVRPETHGLADRKPHGNHAIDQRLSREQMDVLDRKIVLEGLFQNVREQSHPWGLQQEMTAGLQEIC